MHMRVARPMPSCSVWMSACPSLSCSVLYCLETSEHILKLVSQSGKFTILVFRTKDYEMKLCRYSNRDH